MPKTKHTNHIKANQNHKQHADIYKTEANKQINIKQGTQTKTRKYKNHTIINNCIYIYIYTVYIYIYITTRNTQ